MTAHLMSTGEVDDVPADDGDESGGRLSAYLTQPAMAVLLLIPVAFYFWFIHEYGVNAIYYDQWENIALLTHSSFFSTSYAGHTSLGMLWTQHNENRMLFPNLVVLLLGGLTHLNILTELYLSAVLLMTSVSLIIFAHRQGRVSIPWILYLPVVLLMLSTGQYGDILFGFQMAWYLVLLALATVLFLLSSSRDSWLILVASIGVAVIGSYSSLQGLLIWPAGLLVLLWKHRSRPFVVAWLMAAVVTTGLYLYHYSFQSSGGGGSYLLAHPFSAIEFFFLSIGDGIGERLPQGASSGILVAVGVATVLLAVLSLLLYWRYGYQTKSPIGPALICFGVLFSLMITIGRGQYGLSDATQSRYATFDLLTLVGCYLCLLERWPSRSETAVKFDVNQSLVDQAVRTVREDSRWLVLASLRLLVIVLVVIEVVGGVLNGVAGGRASRQGQQLAALVTAHAQDAPDSLIKSALFPNPYVDYNQIRGLAEHARANGLSLFATGEASALSHMRLPKVPIYPLQTSISKPTNDTRLRGVEFLVARAAGDYPINAVDFRIEESGGQQHTLHSKQFLYGWLGAWETKDVPNGTYSVESVAHDTAGEVKISRPVTVTVEN